MHQKIENMNFSILITCDQIYIAIGKKINWFIIFIIIFTGV